MSEKLAKCATCGGKGELIGYNSRVPLYWVSCYEGQVSGAHAPGAAGLWRTEREASVAWNTYQERENELKRVREELEELKSARGPDSVECDQCQGVGTTPSSGPPSGDMCETCFGEGRIFDLHMMVNEDTGYYASLLQRLLATRQGRIVGYEPPEVQALWREVDALLNEKEGAQ